MSNVRPRVRVPQASAPGETVSVRTLISHPMEGGMRRDAEGATVPRRIINRFTCAFEGETVFECELGVSVSANPYIEFDLRAERSGRLVFNWHDDNGEVYAVEEDLVVGQAG